ncbi:MAG: copper homeostasis protein CutC [Gemmataceae bacterium]
MATLLEITVTSPADARRAVNAGADRLELCAALDCGGLTPSLGAFLETRRATALPIVVLLRPRPGGFVYSEEEFAVMRRDLDLFRAHGADGFVVGLLDQHNQLDEDRLRLLVKSAHGKDLIFSRAFDLAAEPFHALDRLVDLGFRRILTSGQQPTAPQGATFLRRLHEHARGRIGILPGGGVRPDNAAELLRATGCNQVHASARRRRVDDSAGRQEFGFCPGAEGCIEETDEGLVRALREALDR